MGTFISIVYVFSLSLDPLLAGLCLVRIIYVVFTFEQVALSYEDGRPVEGKGVGRKVLDRVQETYDSELNGKDFAYDGEKTLFTLGSLARNKLEFTVVLEDVTSNRFRWVWLLMLSIDYMLPFRLCNFFLYPCIGIMVTAALKEMVKQMRVTRRG